MTPTFIRAIDWDHRRARCARFLAAALPGTVIWDETRNAFDTFQAALAAAGDGPAIHVEDDAQPTTNWRAKTEAVIAQHPDDIIQFWSGRAADTETRWKAAGTFSCSLCIYLPPGASAALNTYADTWRQEHPEHPTGFDLTIRDWLNGSRYLMSVPSLVQHRPWPSAIDPRRSTNRQSRTFSP